MFRLSKSKLLSAQQCPKRLYLEVHFPELAEDDSGTEAVFAIGHDVGRAAQGLFPGGILIEHQDDLAEALRETEAALARGGDLVLFEAAVQHQGILIRADVLIRRNGRWRFVEVKSSTSVREYHLDDAAIQAWVLRGAGYPIERVSILHIDSGFIYAGDGDYRGLFAEVDVTDQVAMLQQPVPERVAQSREILAGPVPDVAVGRQCKEPFACPFLSYCGRDGPDFPLSIFSSNWRLRDRLAAAGFRDVREVPLAQIESARLQRIWRATTSGKPELDPEAAALLNALDYPRYFLDFETIQFAVPIWPGTSPYEQLPFQWSCHVQSANGHLDSLAELAMPDAFGNPPMRQVAERLLERLEGVPGPILTYSGFENTTLRALATRYPDLAQRLDALRNRLVDLLPIVREHYYHPAMMGSWSIKSVLPTIAPDLDYEDLEDVRDGISAQVAYREMIASGTTAERKAQLERALLVYCERDTLAMVKLADFLSAAHFE